MRTIDRKLPVALLLATGLLGSGCGGSEETKAPGNPVSSLVRPPPPGYRYGPPANESVGRELKARLKSDFQANDVETRTVYKGKRLVAGVIVLRSRRPRSLNYIAAKAMPGSKVEEPVTIGGKRAHLVFGADRLEVAVVDTFGRVVLIVLSEQIPLAKRVAAPMLR
jgi:hypothetical protein